MRYIISCRCERAREKVREKRENHECCKEHKHEQGHHHHGEEGCCQENGKHKGGHRRPHGKMRRHPKVVTKLFVNKVELVEFVNQIGDEGHKIEIYKIEDELYKVEIKIRPAIKKEFKEEE